ncbi:MAG: OmpA family protein, partial [Pseudomonadota bacterium]
MNASPMTRLLLLGLLLPAGALAAGVEETAIGETAERHLPTDTPYMQWVTDPSRVETEFEDRIMLRETTEEAYETIKLSNLVEPIRFETGVADIPDETIASLAEILERMRDRMNVRLHLIGHADNQPLSPRLEAVYGDNAGLSRERAGEVAELFKAALGLPAESITYDWMGDEEPVASNETAEGRAQNRRVEVEVWYDEPGERVALEEFLVPHQIKRAKVCRMETVCKLRYVEGHARRARVQNLVAPLRYDTDSIDVDEDFVFRVGQALANLVDKQNVAVRFVGYSDNTPLNERDSRLYGDHVGLSRARARRVALTIQDSLGLPTDMIQSDGRGEQRPLGSNRTEGGRAANRRVEV